MERAWEAARTLGSHCEVAAVTTAVMLERMQERAHQYSWWPAHPSTLNKQSQTRYKQESPTHQGSLSLGNTFDSAADLSYIFYRFHQTSKGHFICSHFTSCHSSASKKKQGTDCACTQPRSCKRASKQVVLSKANHTNVDVGQLIQILLHLVFLMNFSVAFCQLPPTLKFPESGVDS